MTIFVVIIYSLLYTIILCYILLCANMEYYSSLPTEIKGKIISYIHYPIFREFKYASKEVFESTRYCTNVGDREVYLKHLFIKNKDNTYKQFYYNLTCIKNQLIVTDDKYELGLAPRIIKKLKYVHLRYITSDISEMLPLGDISQTFPLIQSFIEGSGKYMNVYLSSSKYTSYSITRRDNLVVADITRLLLNDGKINNYLKNIDSLLIPNVELDVAIGSIPDIANIIIDNHIHILHFEDIDNFNYFSTLIRLVDTLYIISGSDTGFYHPITEIDNNIIYNNITKVVFEDILISNQDMQYKIYSKMFPNAKIEVYKFDDSDVVVRNNVVIVEDDLRVTRLNEQRLSKLLINNIKPRFPNLRDINIITVSASEYENSIELIKIAIKHIDDVSIMVESRVELLLDIFKYITLLDDVVNHIISISINDHSICVFNKTRFGIELKIRDISILEHLDVSYIAKREDIMLNVSDFRYKAEKDISDFISRSNIRKILLSKNLFYLIGKLPKNVNSVYVSGVVPPICGGNDNIEHVFFDEEDNLKISLFGVMFPKATFHFVRNIS